MAGFNTPDIECINRKINSSAVEISDKNFDCAFDISRCVQWIKDNGYKKVCLQLPDHILPHGLKLCRRLKSELGIDVYILADTTYNSCCVDEVASQHIGADAILHYGHSCLSSQLFPVLDVYDKQLLNVDNAILKIEEIFHDCKTNIVLFYDVSLHHLKEEIAAKFFDKFTNSYIASVPDNRYTKHGLFGRLIVNKNKLDQGSTILNKYRLVFIGKEGPTIHNMAISSQAQELYLMDPTSCSITLYSESQWFKRRRYLIEKCKDVRNIGILVCTLSVMNYNLIIQRLKQIIKSSGKKCYTLTVGKPNVAKLANLSEIELFVLIACPENDLYDCREFHSPIIYPYELELALNPKRDQYDNNYATDFNELLPEGNKFCELSENINDAPDVSLVTGKVRNIDNDKNNVCLEDYHSGSQLDSVKKENWAVQELGIGKAINDRSWKGLEQDLENSKPELAGVGRKGIASGYSEEPL